MALEDNPAKTLAQIAMQAEMLDADTEHALAYAWRDHRDERALHRLITAYLRLAVAMAAKFRRYGVPMGDLVQEASVGLMKAAEKFDPDQGVRFSTYAIWWIRASIQDYVMRNWSLVRTGSTGSQKSLFFNLRRLRARLEREAAIDGEDLNSNQVHKTIAKELGVPLRDVQMMDGRLSGGDMSLNISQSNSEEGGREWIDTLADAGPQASDIIEDSHDLRQLRTWLLEAAKALSRRERLIIRERKLRTTPRTLESLGKELSLSKERVRQLETIALGKLRKGLEEQSPEVHHFFS